MLVGKQNKNAKNFHAKYKNLWDPRWGKREGARKNERNTIKDGVWEMLLNQKNAELSNGTKNVEMFMPKALAPGGGGEEKREKKIF